MKNICIVMLLKMFEAAWVCLCTLYVNTTIYSVVLNPEGDAVQPE